MTDYKDDSIWLMQGDCLERMKEIPDGSIDLILADPPYGATNCKWDSIIPLNNLWDLLKIKSAPNSSIVITASQPFTTILISSNLEMFKYTWVWDKRFAANFVQAKFAPMKVHEDIVVFSNCGVTTGSKNPIKYNPQKTKRDKPIKQGANDYDGGAIGYIYLLSKLIKGRKE